MKHIYHTLFVALMLISGAVSCRRQAPELTNPNDLRVNTESPSQVFLAFWQGMNNSYGFWDIDPTDWDAVYDHYLPIFERLDTELATLPTTEERMGRLQELYTEMCSKLIDHHLTLTFYPETDSAFRISPGMLEAQSRDYAHQPQVINNTLRTVYEANKQAGRITDDVVGVYNDPTGENSMLAISYKIDGVIYLHFTSFSFTGAIANDPGNPAEQALRNFQRLILETPDIQGVIIDVRDNGGGYLSDMDELLAYLIDTPFQFAYTRVKSGLGRLDYGPWVPAVVTPAAQHRGVEAPIVVLTNLYSVSMSELTAMAVSALPNGCVIGERSFGGTGPLAGDFTYSYNGSVSNPAVQIYCATAMTKDINGQIHEGIGIVPDIEVLQDAAMEAQLANGVDLQLERALEYIRTGK
ncbi:MAG TPA: hypothetical protein H9888_00230 [Candidatus Rikenella faecigallinarum]|uniref:Tail specific protease domain-containing protein n=1 Tax=Candidatus Rikenella faecigallinarum TaxID=2838745 RepID=A0A9D1TWX8_9BACT|nr:hypothetical protein [Candidatus Rikenella faecigallinarum]